MMISKILRCYLVDDLYFVQQRKSSSIGSASSDFFLRFSHQLPGVAQSFTQAQLIPIHIDILVRYHSNPIEICGETAPKEMG